MKQTVDIIIPTYKPGKKFETVLKKLEEQSYPVEKIIVMNTEEKFWNQTWEQRYPLLEVHHLKKAEFDHGGTRKKASFLSGSQVMIFMTQDAMPADQNLIRHLIEALESRADAGAAYARQLPDESCSYLESCTRSFNYPEHSFIKTKKELPVYGIKTFFCSNVCAAYKKDLYEQLGGFVEKTIFNEDMIYAASLIQQGYAIVYAADAQVIHSHNYTGMQQLHRNFDLGVSQAEHPEIFSGIASEGEGIRLVKRMLVRLCRTGRFHLIPQLVWQSGCKYIGYFWGRRYQKLPCRILLWFTMNKDYWTVKEK